MLSELCIFVVIKVLCSTKEELQSYCGEEHEGNHQVWEYSPRLKGHSTAPDRGVPVPLPRLFCETVRNREDGPKDPILKEK